jgi:hypothetical protein
MAVTSFIRVEHQIVFEELANDAAGGRNCV